MEVPAPSSGTVKEIRVKVGDKVSQGVASLTMDGEAKGAPAPTPAATRAEAPAPKAPAKPAPAAAPAMPPQPAAAPGQPAAAPVPPPMPTAREDGTHPAHASPGV